MADSFGLLTLPASAGDTPVGDPGLYKLAQFIAAVINDNTSTAWSSAQPAPGGSETPTVKTILLFNPEQQSANDEHFPALFVWRELGRLGENAQDRLESIDTVKLLWVFPKRARTEARAREQFANSVVKSVAKAIRLGRDSAWLDTGDTDPVAASVAADADSFLLSKATLLASHTYSGAALDGALGDDTLSPRLSLTLTLATAAPGTYNTTDPIVITYLDVFGDTATGDLTPTTDTGPEVLSLDQDMSQLVSIAVPAQGSTDGAIAAGNAARAGRGSSLYGRTEFDRITLSEWRVVPLMIELDGNQNADQRLKYHGVSITLEVTESLAIDIEADDDRYPEVLGGDITVIQGEPYDDGGSFTVQRSVDT